MSASAVASFTHLEVHSHYTLLGATASVEALAARAAAESMTHLALTDHQALYGAVAFARACRRHNVQPITGMTVGLRFPSQAVPVADRQPGRLVLLARDQSGYRSLCRLASWLQGHPQRERRLQQGLPWDVLGDACRGLLCIDGGQAGWLFRLLQAERRSQAARYLGQLGDIFGENACVGLEWQRAQDRPLVAEAAALAQRFGLQTAALQPVYCLHKQERATLRLLTAMARRCTLQTVPPDALPGKGRPGVDVHWLSREEIVRRFQEFPEALRGVEEIIQQCRKALPDGDPVWPAPPLAPGETPAEALRAQAQEGLARRYGPRAGTAVRERLQEELQAINRHGFAPLFLVVADVARFARSEQIPVSTRGSVANSLVAYCLGITTVDPVAHDLLFARFLNPARQTPPDIDLDFCSRQRDRVLDYVRRTYGREHVALVATMNTMRPRSALRETAKAHGYDEAQIRQLLQRLPQGWHRGTDIDDGENLDALSDAGQRRLLRAAAQVVGRPHHAGLHPGGIVITPGPLTDHVPLQWARKGFLSTQFDHVDVEAVGLPKIDLLGIRALTVLADAAALVREHQDATFRLEAIDTQDAQTGQCLSRGQTIGVFQCESTGAQRTLRQLQARSIRDLAVANAFFKPGPATGGMARAFIRRYRGEEPVTLLHPSLADILQPTQGVLLFQEQVLRVAREIAGLSWEEADRLRRGMSKMRPREMTALQEQFLAGCRRPAPDGPQMSAEQARQLWEQVVAFAGYGFNQGHATAYADVSYRSAYLKTHYPAHFLCARLANGGGFHHPAIYMAEARRLNVDVRAPHVNHSGRRFTLGEDEGRPVLWMGLGQVRGLRQRAIAAIVAGAPFAGLRDLLARVALQDKEVRHLIQGGALEGLGPNRAALLAQARGLLRADSPRQLALDFMETPAVEAESAAQRIAWEQHVLGLPVSVHPLQTVRQEIGDVWPLDRLPQSAPEMARIAGVRLPGRTGGRGFFVGDGRGLVVVRTREDAQPATWQPLLLRGRWQSDAWGGGWFQAGEVSVLR